MPDYTGVTANRFPVDDSPPDDIWLATCPMSAFASFLDDPETWVELLPRQEKMKPMGVTLDLPFSIDIRGFDEKNFIPTATIQGIDGTTALTVRASKGALVSAYKVFIERHRELARRYDVPLPVPDLFARSEEAEETLLKIERSFLDYITWRSYPVGEVFDIKSMPVIIDKDNGRAYVHFQLDDQLEPQGESATLATFILAVAEGGREYLAKIMGKLKPVIRTISGTPPASIAVASKPPPKEREKTPKGQEKKRPDTTEADPQPEFGITYNSDGTDDANTCFMAVCTYTEKPPTIVPDYGQIKDYADAPVIGMKITLKTRGMTGRRMRTRI